MGRGTFVADEKAAPAGALQDPPPQAVENLSLGQFLIGKRRDRGFTTEQVVNETHIPPHYVRAIENDDYGLISDELYLLPFLRKYAAFIGLDPEDIASRFVREVQKTESSPPRMAEPIAMIASSQPHKPRRIRYVAIGVIVAAIALVAVELSLRHSKSLNRIVNPAGSPESTAVPPTQASPSESSADAPKARAVAPAGGGSPTSADSVPSPAPG